MNRILFVLMLVFCASSQALEKHPQITNHIDLENFPKTLKYTATISDITNFPNKRKHKVKVSFFAKNSDSKALNIDSFKRVVIVKNQHALTLSKAKDIQQIKTNASRHEDLIVLFRTRSTL